MRETFLKKANDDKTGLLYPINPWFSFDLGHLRSRLIDEVGEWLKTLPFDVRNELLDHVKDVAHNAELKPPEKGRLIHIANLAFIVYTAIDKKESRSYEV